jgi:hypothetical protein
VNGSADFRLTFMLPRIAATGRLRCAADPASFGCSTGVLKVSIDTHRAKSTAENRDRWMEACLRHFGVDGLLADDGCRKKSSRWAVLPSSVRPNPDGHSRVIDTEGAERRADVDALHCPRGHHRLAVHALGRA